MSLFTVLIVTPHIAIAADSPCASPDIHNNAQEIFSAIKKNGGKAQWSELAKATFYADMFNGRPTSNGTLFLQSAMIAAHNARFKRAPGSRVTVENTATGQFACVTIADTGRLGKDHIDLSKAAFQAAGFSLGQGTGKVNIRDGWRPDCPPQAPLQRYAKSSKPRAPKRTVASRSSRTANADQ